jgi:hypothetical protein
LLFNPIIPVHMSRSDWQVVNVITAASFIAWGTYSIIQAVKAK